jgi:hypothetical protein
MATPRSCGSPASRERFATKATARATRSRQAQRSKSRRSARARSVWRHARSGSTRKGAVGGSQRNRAERRRLAGRSSWPAVMTIMQEPIARSGSVLPRRCHGPHSGTRAPPKVGAKTNDFRPKRMRSSGLEPPRAVKPTRPSTSYSRARCSRERPNRPSSALSRTRRTHMEARVLPRCCHGLGYSSTQGESLA